MFVRDFKSYAGDEGKTAVSTEGKAADVNTNTEGSKDGGDGKTFTQAQVDNIVAKRFKKEKEENERLLNEYKALQQTQGLSTQQLEEYQKKIGELENMNLSKEEIAKKEQERLQTTYKKHTDDLTSERDLFKNLYSTSTIERAIAAAASDPEIKALRAEQMIMMLKSQTRLVQKGTGAKAVFEVAVDWSDEVDGEHKTIQIPVKEALKRMREQPAIYGNLFESDAKGGLGGETVSQGDGNLNPTSYSSPEAYKKNRDAILAKSVK